MMRASSIAAPVLGLLLVACVAASGGDDVRVVITNDSTSAQRLRVSIDGNPLIDEFTGVTNSEPSIVSTSYLRLPAGAHRIEVVRGTLVRDLPFSVRSGARTNLHVQLKDGETVLSVSYGEKLFI